MKIINLIGYVNDKAGSLGVGIVDHIEDRMVGIKSREIYEAPAAVVIVEAHKDLEKMVLTSHELRFKRVVDEQWSWLVYSGLWKDPLRSHLDKFIDATQELRNTIESLGTDYITNDLNSLIEWVEREYHRLKL